MRKFLCFLFFVSNLCAMAQTAQLTCNTGWPYNSNFVINNILQDEGTCNNFNPKINITVLDSCSFIPWTTDSCIYGYFNQLNYNDCTGNSTCMGHPQPYKYFQFDVNDTAQMAALANFLSTIPNGHHILAFTFNTAPYSVVLNWPAVQSALTNLGSSMISTIPDNFSFIFYIKKGFPSTLHEIAATSILDTISVTVTIECLPASVNENTIESSLITLFPNPATNELRIQNAKCKIESVEIHDVLGENVLSFSFRRRSLEDEVINITSLTPGIYFVKVKTDKGIITKKFIKQ